MDPWVIAVIVLVIVVIILIIIIAANNNSASTGNSTLGKVQPAYLQHMKVVPATTSTVINEPIPRKVHQIWVGSKPVPKHTKDWVELCKKYGYEYKLWRDDDFKTLINQKYFDEMRSKGCYQGCADVARYEIVYQNGGLYIDMDMAPVDLPIFDFLPKTGFAITLEHHHIDLSAPGLNNQRAMFAANQFILSCPKHNILKRVIDSMPVNFESLRSVGHVGACESTGPHLLTACLHGFFHVIDKNWIMVDSHDSEHFHLIEFYYD